MEKTGETSLPAQKMLERIGFRYLRQICPFDGGPHFGAELKDIAVARRARFLKVREAKDAGKSPRLGLVMADKNGSVRAAQTEYMVRGEEVLLHREICGYVCA